MDLQQRKDKLQQLIAHNKLEEAFREFSLLLPVNSPAASNLVVLENAYWTNLRDEQMDTASRESLTQARNRLTQGLLELLHSLSAAQLTEAQPTDFKSAVAEIRSLLVRQERIPHAFARLEQLIQPAFEHYMALLSPLRVDYTTNHTDHVIAGTLNRDDYLIRLRTIVRGVEELLAKLSAEHERLAGRNFAMGSELAIVSCDRKKIIQRFWRGFEHMNESGQPALFFLLSGQKYGQAESLARRLITLLKEDKYSVKYSGFNQITISIVDLMRDNDQEDCYFSLRKTFNRDLRPEIKGLEELMNRIDTHYPQLSRYRYLPWVLKFSMAESCWPRIGRSTVHWFIDHFCRLSGRFKQTPVFFLIVDLKEDKKRTSKPTGWRRIFGTPSSDSTGVSIDLHAELQQLAEERSEMTRALPPLSLVVEDDLLDWYRTFESNERIREQKVAELIRQLPPGDAWHMADVEASLKAVIEAYQNALHNI